MTRFLSYSAWLLIAWLLGPVSWAADESGRTAVVAQQRMTAESDVGADQLDTDVSVFFVTNRKRQDGRSGSALFDGERGDLRYGSCSVRFSPIPLINELSQKIPFYVPNEFENVLAIEQPKPRQFWQSLSRRVADTTDRSVVVFVHGYNFGFDKGCSHAAALQRKLRGASTVILFSWPSDANPANYVPDRTDLEWSVPSLAEFLEQLIARVEPGRAHLVAHSMGAHGVVNALTRLRCDNGERPMIGQLVLLAPDVDAQTFVERLPRLIPLAQRISLYASDNDEPLKLSRHVNGHPRLGEAGEYLTVVEGMETIDISAVGRYHISGHEYYHYHPLVGADLKALLTTGASASQRSGLRPATRDGSTYWEMASPD